ncbi:MAG: FkbM family methyltransferase [bacterium]
MIKGKNIIRDILSRPIFQSFFEIVLNFSLKVLNVGEGHTVETSGEKVAIEILNKIVKNDQAIVFDVGAHMGEWFNLFKKYYTKKSTVYSFEPSTKSYSELSKIKEGGFYPTNLALGDITEKKFLTFDNKGDTTAYVSNEKNNIKHSEEINVITLDKYCSDNNIKQIDLLKLDVEGYELKVLSGAKEMIKNGNIKLIQFEFGAPSEEKYSLIDFFDILGEQYQICRILKHGYYPLKKYNHYYEIMTLTNFVAIKKDLLDLI